MGRHHSNIVQKQRIKLTNGGYVEHLEGEEGTAWDPYGWDEITVHRNGVTHSIRTGALGYTDLIYPNVYGVQVTVKATEPLEETLYQQIFMENTGYYMDGWRHWIERAKARRSSRCRKCGHNRVRWVAGYPGETLAVCQKCNAVLDCDFNESAII